jgi:hypothetical protein
VRVHGTDDGVLDVTDLDDCRRRRRCALLQRSADAQNADDRRHPERAESVREPPGDVTMC